MQSQETARRRSKSSPKQPAVEASEALVLKAIYSRFSKSAQSLAAHTLEVSIYSEDSGPGKGYPDLLKRSDIHAVIIA